MPRCRCQAIRPRSSGLQLGCEPEEPRLVSVATREHHADRETVPAPVQGDAHRGKPGRVGQRSVGHEGPQGLAGGVESFDRRSDSGLLELINPSVQETGGSGRAQGADCQRRRREGWGKPTHRTFPQTRSRIWRAETATPDGERDARRPTDESRVLESGWVPSAAGAHRGVRVCETGRRSSGP